MHLHHSAVDALQCEGAEHFHSLFLIYKTSFNQKVWLCSIEETESWRDLGTGATQLVEVPYTFILTPSGQF